MIYVTFFRNGEWPFHVRMLIMTDAAVDVVGMEGHLGPHHLAQTVESDSKGRHWHLLGQVQFHSATETVAHQITILLIGNQYVHFAHCVCTANGLKSTHQLVFYTTYLRIEASVSVLCAQLRYVYAIPITVVAINSPQIIQIRKKYYW